VEQNLSDHTLIAELAQTAESPVESLTGPGLYLHIPFCERKCVYCDFYSIEKLEQTNPFLIALEKEIDLVADKFSPAETFQTIFLGGGTPSLLTPAQLGKLFNQLHRRYSIDAAAEITIECNPGTVDAAKLKAYRALGINRISFGVQSFNQDELDFLGRIHNADQARQAVRTARDAGFDNLSVDLIFALPMHTRERWEHSLREAVALEPEHISAYSLIYEEGTPLYAQLQQGLVKPLDEEIDADL
jgi:oxygen-independent coproporphyrinogen-3 oxidase